MILNISIFLEKVRLQTNYYGLLKNLDLPIKVLEIIDYFHVNLGRSLMLLPKPSTAQSAQQVNFFAVYESCTTVSSG